MHLGLSGDILGGAVMGYLWYYKDSRIDFYSGIF